MTVNSAKGGGAGSSSGQTGRTKTSSLVQKGAARFHATVEQMRPLLKQLLDQTPTLLGRAEDFPARPGVYLITDETGHLYTGRCKSLRQRMKNHGGSAPESSTFAFRLACNAFGRKPSYKKGDGRKDLMARPEFKKVFLANVDKLRAMNVRYVEIEDDITQHLFEVYVHLALDTPHNSFATH